MKNKELFEKTIGILVKAYQNGTLVYESCQACAVGNLVANATGVEIVITENGVYSKKDGKLGSFLAGWSRVINLGKGTVRNSNPSDRCVQMLLMTGYTLQELALIEQAFFVGTNLYITDDDHNLSGLMAVCDVLMKIHEADETQIKEAKSLFVLS